MRKLIHEINETSGNVYQLWAEISEVPNPNGSKMLSFTSVWTGAKHPLEEQKRWGLLLSQESINNLKELLEA